jgi:hypothetical protein
VNQFYSVGITSSGSASSRSMKTMTKKLEQSSAEAFTSYAYKPLQFDIYVTIDNLDLMNFTENGAIMRHRLVTQASTTAKAESSLKRID